MRILMMLVGEPHGSMTPVVRIERFVAPYYLFKDAGFDVVLASPEGGDVAWLRENGQRGHSTPLLRLLRRDAAARDALADTLAIAEIVADDFDGAFCIGVTGGVWRPAACDAAAALIGTLLRAGKAVAVLPFRLDLAAVGLATGVLVGGDETSTALPVARALIAALLGEPGRSDARSAADDFKPQEDSEWQS